MFITIHCRRILFSLTYFLKSISHLENSPTREKARLPPPPPTMRPENTIYTPPLRLISLLS